MAAIVRAVLGAGERRRWSVLAQAALLEPGRIAAAALGRGQVLDRDEDERDFLAGLEGEPTMATVVDGDELYLRERGESAAAHRLRAWRSVLVTYAEKGDLPELTPAGA